MKTKVLIIIICIICSLSLSACQSKNDSYRQEVDALGKMDASWIESYDNLEAIAEGSDIIVIGRLIEHTPEKIVDMVFTYEQVEVKKVIKGDLSKKDIISIKITGGILNDLSTPTIEDVTLLEDKTKYILFLDATGEGSYVISGGYQGYSVIEKNDFKLKDIPKDDQYFSEDTLSDNN